MNKLITVLYVLYAALCITGCSVRQSAEYEIRMFMDMGSREVTGYVIDGDKKTKFTIKLKE